MRALRKAVIAFAVLVIPFALPHAANAACASSMAYVFTNGTSALDANTTNANNNQLLSCARNVDNSQIGSSGIYASQIIPGNSSQATFGGSQAYSFPSSISVNGATITNTVTASSSIQGSYFNSDYNGSINKGIFYAGGNNVASLDYNITNANQWTLSAPLTVSGGIIGSSAITATTSLTAGTSVQGRTINSDYNGTTNQGMFYAGGSNVASLDYNVNNANVWTLSAPLIVNGGITASGSSNIPALTTTSIGATSINDSGALAVGGNASVTGTLGITGNTTMTTLTASGTATMAGVVASSQVKSTLPSGALGYDTPMYFDAGSTTGSFHHVLLTGSTAAGACAGPQGGSNCYAVTIAANLAFSSLGSFACTPVNEVDNNGSNYSNIRNNNSPTTYDGRTFYLTGGASGQTVAAVCSGY